MTTSSELRMTGIFKDREQQWLILSLVVIFISRIPFLFSGYGSEEDAWGLILVARNIDLTGIYEVSRMPGHPLQELFLSGIWNWPAWSLNLLTAMVSTAGVYFFMLALKEWKVPHHILAGWILAFTPIYYINSTNVMDYTWAISLVMMSMYFVSKDKFVFAGVMLGLAVGFRITAGAAGIAFAIFLLGQDRPVLKIMILAITSLITALVSFLPAFEVYGTGFFTYYEYFPYPPLLKNIYKATVGAWGVIGTVAVAAGIALAAGNYFLKIRNNIHPTQPSSTFTSAASEAIQRHQSKWLLLMSLAAMALFTFSFLKIPQKSAFVIPVIPFLVILFCLLLTDKQLKFVAGSLIFSCFFFGINLDDNLRGSSASPLALKTKIGNTPVAVDPLAGMVIADHQKRNRKIDYAQAIASQLMTIQNKTVIIAGWWQNEINYFLLNQKPAHLELVYYENKETLKSFSDKGFDILYLPEQDYYNDLRFGGTGFTNDMAEAFPYTP